MSFNFRDINPVLGANAQVEINNGASAPVLVKIPLVDSLNFTAAANTNAVNTMVWVAPLGASTASGALPLGQYQLLEVSARYHVAGSAGYALMVERTPSGTALGSGVNLLSAAMNLNATAADTTQAGVLSNSLANANAILQPGDGLSLLFTGTSTGLANLTVTLYVARVV